MSKVALPWQRITSSEQHGKIFANTYRLRVIGGWIVRTTEQCVLPLTAVIASSSIFVPDPDHEWIAGTV